MIRCCGRAYLILAMSLVCLSTTGRSSRADDTAVAEQERHFETRVRPILAQRCAECHGMKKQEGGLRLDQRAAALRGNDAGPVIVAGQPDESRLVQVIRYADDDVQMPPTEKLPAAEIDLLTDWIRNGAHWPAAADGGATTDGVPRREDGSIDFAQAVAAHWSYRPVTRPSVPQVAAAADCRNTLDQFVVAQLEERGMSLSPQADRRTLIRRATFDLLGIPPTYEEVAAFVADPAPDAYEQLIDRLLASPHYGQRWGRHWLDVARYADTKGYVFTENRFYPYSYTYRDYVISAFNADKPYDRFVTEQLAADQLGLAENDPALAALGFLTVGPRFLNNQQDIIDDRIDVVTRGLMGMTLGCARCHDHKYDPVSMKDYYALYGVFESSEEPDTLPIVGNVDETPEYLAYERGLKERQQAVDDYKRQTFDDLLRQARERADDYVLAAAASMRQVDPSVELKYAHGRPRERLTGLWKNVLERRVRKDDPVFGPWRHARDVRDGSLADALQEYLLAAGRGEGTRINPLVVDALCTAHPETMADLARAYGTLFADIDRQWRELTAANNAATALPDAAAEQLRAVLYGKDSVTDVTLERDARAVFERDNRDKIKELERKVGEWETTSGGAPPRAMVLVDRERPVEPVVFLRGNPGRRGDRVARRFPEVLGGTDDGAFPNGSGRLDLARSITSAENPLTARVIVNRVWQHHFGDGLVSTTSDFGARSETPSHPELLDDLAATFMEEGWSLKDLHRKILLSATYRQQSADRPECRTQDPENRLLWRQNRRRLEFEPMRDALLFVAGRLDPSLGGRPVNIVEQPNSRRRTIYAQVDRNNLPGLFRTFDFPTPDTSSPGRPVTTVPQQALYEMNAPFLQEIAATIAARPEIQQASGDERTSELFRVVLGRDPAEEERALIGEYVSRDDRALREAAQALLMTNEFLFVD